MDEAKDRLKDARLRAGHKSGSDAALAFGWNKSTYLSTENGYRGLSASKAQQYARAFGTYAEWLLYGKNEPEAPSAVTKPIIDKQRAIALLKPFTVPVYGSLTGGNEEYLEATGEYLDYIPAPASLMDAAGAYALYMPGNTMEPRYLEGESLFVNPMKLPRAGEYAAIQHLMEVNGEELLVIQVGRYEGINKGSRVFSRHNGEDLEIPAEKMRAMQKIVVAGEC